MNTPLQELLERVQEYRDAETSPIVVSRLNSVCVDILGMLQKEKEVIMDAWMDDRFPLDKEWVKKCAEQYYNETFKSVPQENNVVCSECGSEYEVQISVEHNWKMYCNNCCPVRNAKTTI